MRGPRSRVPFAAACVVAALVACAAGDGLAQKPATAPAAARSDEITIDAETFGGVSLRSIGPAAMSGRIAAIDAVEGDRLTLYVGAAGGGVWKSQDGGTTFEPVFDKYCQSIGAIAIDRRRPKTVWVGTGESWTRNSVSVGDGIYKTTDGGDNWQRMGLEDCERIARIVTDPQRSDTVYVAATGHLWDAGQQRGVFRTRDGGKTWTRVLFVDENTGCADVAIDPSDPNTLYAAMWQFRRRPWSFSSGGPGSGLYKSTDGGDTWRKLTKGLPAGDLGRIGISVSPARPSRVYAFVEAKRKAMFRSDDKGETWTEGSSAATVTERPFYFAIVVADPKDPNRVYKTSTGLWASEDSSRTFSAIGGGVHSDFHALWINPRNPEQLFCGTDGGVYTSVDRGNTWRFLGNIPVGQFYHVSYDMEWPYNVYGGLQDNGSWTGPSRRPGGIANRHWRVLGGGDGFWAFVDPNTPDIAYVEYQDGNILRVARSTGETKQIKPLEDPKDAEYRFNWNTPIHVSASKAGTLYMGSQFLFRSRDHGDTWERISPDLTTNDPAKLKQAESGGLSVDNSSAENHCTIFTICESPKNPDVVWVGTDDGNVQLTRDGGKTWTNVGKKIPGLPPATWVTCIEASHFDEGTAFATFDGHGLGDMRTYLYKTADFGRTWQSLATDGLKGYAHVVRQDLVRPDLLFLGTEFGLFVSIDGGAQWAPIRGNFPPVAVRDLAIHPRDGDLLVATHGRALWILDDLTPLRTLTRDLAMKDAAILPSRPSVMVIPASEQRFDASEYAGQVPQEAAFVTYYLKKRQLFGDIRLQFFDAKGTLISTVPGGKRRGINRVAWPMRMKAPKVPPSGNLVPLGFAAFGPRLPAGDYPVKMIRGNDTLTTTVTLVADPRSTHTVADRAVQQETTLKLYKDLETLSYVVDAIVDVRDQARARVAGLGDKDALAKKLAGVADRLETLRRTVVASREGGQLAGEEQLREKMGSLYGAVNGYEGRPTGSQLKFVDVLEGKMAGAQRDFEAIAKDLPVVNADLATKKLQPIAAMSRDDWQKRQKN
ncbi:MAG: glycosyl hydrolase [Candidatus Eisenbacteria bacterium]|nr:glycosyl hydrolase [Candidatus Eisenbacteria bacterium]